MERHQMAENVHSQPPHTGPQCAVGRNIGHHSPGSTPQGGRVRADSIHCCQSHCSSSVLGTPSQSRKSDWWPAGARGSCSHSRCVPHTVHPAVQSHPHTDTPPGMAEGTAPRVHPSWSRSKGRHWCTHQNDCSLDREELRQRREQQREAMINIKRIVHQKALFLVSNTHSPCRIGGFEKFLVLEMSLSPVSFDSPCLQWIPILS